MAKKGRQLPGSKTKTELEIFSPKDRSKVFKKPKKGDDIKKEIEDNKMEFDPSFRITKVDPEKRTIKGFKIGKKGAEFYLESGDVLMVQPNNPYRIRAYEDCVLVEVTYGGRNDQVHMMEDDFGRVKVSKITKWDLIYLNKSREN